MTLDEAIEGNEKASKQNFRVAKNMENAYGKKDQYVKVVERVANIQRQTAEWLKELKAYRACITSRSFWGGKHCEECSFYDDCPFDTKEDEP